MPVEGNGLEPPWYAPAMTVAPTSRAGFSLLETLVALTLLGMALLFSMLTNFVVLASLAKWEIDGGLFIATYIGYWFIGMAMLSIGITGMLVKLESEKAAAPTTPGQSPGTKPLEAAKQNLIGGFPLRIDSNKKILGYLSMIGFYKLPLTYLDDFNSNIEAVSLAQIHETMRRRVHPDRMVTVIVGGKK